MEGESGTSGSFDETGHGEVTGEQLPGGTTPEAGTGSNTDASRSTKIESAAETFARVAAAQKKTVDKIPDSMHREEEESDSIEDDTNEDEESDDATESDEDDSIPVPGSWNKKEAEAWSKTPREAQEAFIRIQNSLDAAASRAAQRAQQLEKHIQQLEQNRSSSLPAEVDEVVSRWYGEAPKEEVIRNYVEFDHLVRVSPFHALTKIAQIHGKSPVELVDAYDSWVDDKGYLQNPGRIIADAPKIPDEITQRLAQLEEKIKGSEKQSLSSSVQAFKQERNAEGELLRPYFDEIEQDIIVRAQAMRLQGKEITLETIHEAYQAEVWANPETRRKLIAKQNQQKMQTIQKRSSEASRSERSLESSQAGGMHSQKRNYNESAAETFARVARKMRG